MPSSQGPQSTSESPPSEDGDGRFMRFVFYFFWVFAVPFALAFGNVWLLTPAPGAKGANALRDFVSKQPIPSGIVLFTLFAMIVWRFRYDLPLAGAIGVGGRRDVPVAVRSRFEDAAALLDEARRILRAHRREIERELTASERDQLAQALAGLERAMTGERFDAPEFDAAHARADRLVGEHLARWRKSEMREYAESIVIAVAVALILRAFVVEAFKIPSGSMIPTLMVGDHIFVNKFIYGPAIPLTAQARSGRACPPQRGDVMVFAFPENMEQDFIKRVIADPRRHARGQERPPVSSTAGSCRTATSGSSTTRTARPGALRRVPRRQGVLHALRRPTPTSRAAGPRTSAPPRASPAGAASAAGSRARSRWPRTRCG